jgi:hypothetical protein
VTGVFVWPAVVLVALVMLFGTSRGNSLISGLSGRVKSLSAFGVSLELTPQAATEAKATIETTFADYRSIVVREFDRQVSTRNVDAQFRKLCREFIWPHLSAAVTIDLRCTLHVPDILFTEALYQLLDYYPTGGGRGRTYSSRYGILGTCFRSEMDSYRPDVPTVEEQLIVEWGMNSQEAAAAGQGRKSFACFIVRKDAHEPTLGIVYLDTKVRNAFGPTDDSADIGPFVAEGLQRTGLINTLERLGEAMRERGPALSILGGQ